MKTTVRIAAFAAFAFTVHAAHTAWLTRIQPGISTVQAVRQLNGNEADWRALRWFEAEKNLASSAAALAVGMAALLCLRPQVRRELHRRGMLPLLAATTLLGGCMKPYDTPEFVTIDTAETGFLVPLEGDTRDQAKFESELRR